MIVMPSNNSGTRFGWLAGTYPGRIGHLYSPGGLRGPWDFIPFALDNGRFAATTKGREWNREAFLGMLDRIANTLFVPLWLVVPDIVGDRDGTLLEWDCWATKLEAYRWPLAMAVQDGMTEADVPREASIVFVGGTPEWKKRTLRDWCDAFPGRVHVGAINSEAWLWECHRAGAVSCDGTGWFRGDQEQYKGLLRYLQRSQDGHLDPQQRLFEQRVICKCGCEITPSYAECPRCRSPRP